jgi:hypothetical protein
MTYEKFSAENAAMLLIDHQVGTIGLSTTASACQPWWARRLSMLRIDHA